ncbi:MAG: hypothetical protein KGJ77_08200 [Acidobacteriota bacterium]|nr:hypothetical protein [Acidobacteriota bacterium]
MDDPKGTGVGAAGGPSPCESCGSPEAAAALAAVHRVYLMTDGEGAVVGERVLDEVEQWCLSCRTLYPNRPAGGP